MIAPHTVQLCGLICQSLPKSGPMDAGSVRVLRDRLSALYVQLETTQLDLFEDKPDAD